MLKTLASTLKTASSIYSEEQGCILIWQSQKGEKGSLRVASSCHAMNWGLCVPIILEENLSYTEIWPSSW